MSTAIYYERFLQSVDRYMDSLEPEYRNQFINELRGLELRHYELSNLEFLLEYLPRHWEENRIVDILLYVFSLFGNDPEFNFSHYDLLDLSSVIHRNLHGNRLLMRVENTLRTYMSSSITNVDDDEHPETDYDE